ncbi:hypothetical protein JCM3774_005590 [Rhodotorula dairenensis]
MVRFKHRYLLVHLVFPDQLQLPSSSSAGPSAPSTPTTTPTPQSTLTESSLIGLLRDSLSVNFGDVGAGEVGGTFSIKYLSPTTSTVIIRVSREHYRTLWAALTLLRKVGGHECVARVIHVSGTIRKTQHCAIAHDRTQILLAFAGARQQRQRPRRGAQRGTDSDPDGSIPSGSSKSRTTVGQGERPDAAREQDGEEGEVQRLLRESEDRIGAIEA